jgi:nitrogen-specific signal transduction histidine kinase
MVVGAFSILSCIGAFVLWRAWRVQRALALQLREMRDLLSKTEHLLRRRAVLADEMAHEVKNPLSAIVCSAEALELLAGNSLPPDQRRCLGLIREFSDHVHRLVSDFLDLSRVEGGRVTPDPTDVDIKLLINGLKDLVGPSAARRGVALMVETSDEDLIAHCDSRHIKQVLFNLLQNALKFTPSGGSVLVRAAQHENESIALQVKDTGAGIDPKFLSRIFEPYVSKSPGTDTEDRGVGIGLAVCRALLYLNGGDIRVESVPGEGSSFTIVLPLGVKSEAPIGPGSFARRTDRAQFIRGTRVLVCEEDRGCGEAASALLKAWGAMVDQVNSASEMVERLGAGAYDTVLVSSNTIRSIDGSALSRAREGGAHVVATSPSKNSNAFSPEELEADAVINGPLDGERLLESLERLRSESAHSDAISPA